MTAWYWAVFAIFVWCATVIASNNTSGMLDHLGYAAVICLLAPAIAVLGARRPGVGAWSGFVVLPMLVVMQWPSVSQAFTGSLSDAFELPVPVMLGCGLVLIMGLGNYFGTRFTLPVMLIAAGIGCILSSLVQADTRRSPDVDRMIHVASVIFSCASLLLIARMPAAREKPASDNPEDTLTRLNIVWDDFQQLFGIVWAKRVMDRMNQFSTREKWPITLQLTGFEPSAPDSNPEIASATIDRIRWVMRRFVDPEWLDARLGNQNHKSAADLGSEEKVER